jgi:hypothetical protein
MMNYNFERKGYKRRDEMGVAMISTIDSINKSNLILPKLQVHNKKGKYKEEESPRIQIDHQ